MDGTLSEDFLAKLVSFICSVGSLGKHLHISNWDWALNELEDLARAKGKADLL